MAPKIPLSSPSPGRRKSGHEETPPHKESRGEVGAATLLSYEFLQNDSTRLIEPLGEVLNYLRERNGTLSIKTRYPGQPGKNEAEISSDRKRLSDNETFFDEYKMRVEQDTLPRLREALQLLTGSEEIGSQVSTDLIEKVADHVEQGGRVARGLARHIIMQFTTLHTGAAHGKLSKDAERVVDALSKDATFSTHIASVGEQLYMNASESPLRALRGTVHAPGPARLLLDAARNVVATYEREGKIDVPGNAVTVWKSDVANPEDAIATELLRLRKDFPVDLRAIADRLLHELYVPGPGGTKIRAHELATSRDQKFRLISTQFNLPTRAAAAYYTRAASLDPTILIADASTVTPGTRGRVTDENKGAGYPLSALAAHFFAEMSDEEHADTESAQSLEWSIRNLKTALRNLFGEATRRAGKAAEKETSDHFDVALRALSPALLEKVFKAAHAIAKDEDSFSRLHEPLAAQSLLSWRIQKAFSHELFTKPLVENGLSLEEIIRAASRGTVSRVQTTGAWFTKNALETYAATESDVDSITKGVKVQRFIRTLPERATEAVAACKECSAEEKNEMLLLARACAELCNETWLTRLYEEGGSPDETLSKGQRASVGRAAVTARLLEKFADAYRSLFKSGLVSALPVHIEYETEQEALEAKNARATEEAVFAEKQRETLLTQLRKLTAVLHDTSKDFRGTLGGVLGFALSQRKKAQSTAGRRDLIRAKMEELLAADHAAAVHKEKFQNTERKPYMVQTEDGRLLEPAREHRALLDTAETELLEAQRALRMQILTEVDSLAEATGWKSSLTEEFDSILARAQHGDAIREESLHEMNEKMQESATALKDARTHMEKAVTSLALFNAHFNANHTAYPLARKAVLWYENSLRRMEERFSVIKAMHETVVAYTYVTIALPTLKTFATDETLSSEDRANIKRLVRDIEGSGSDTSPLSAPSPAYLPLYKTTLYHVFEKDAVDSLFDL